MEFYSLHVSLIIKQANPRGWQLYPTLTSPCLSAAQAQPLAIGAN